MMSDNELPNCTGCKDDIRDPSGKDGHTHQHGTVEHPPVPAQVEPSDAVSVAPVEAAGGERNEPAESDRIRVAQDGARTADEYIHAFGLASWAQDIVRAAWSSFSKGQASILQPREVEQGVMGVRTDGIIPVGIVLVNCTANAGHCWANGVTYPESHRCGDLLGHDGDHTCSACGKTFNNNSDYLWQMEHGKKLKRSNPEPASAEKVERPKLREYGPVGKFYGADEVDPYIAQLEAERDALKEKLGITQSKLFDAENILAQTYNHYTIKK